MNLYSVVMAVYAGDVAAHFREAIDSVLSQTLPPDELIIVVDGPVTQEIENALFEVSAVASIRIIRLKDNVGPGPARHLAITEAKHSLVGVMDSDDICVPNRFEQQIHLLNGGEADIVGGWIEEFDDHPQDIGRIRITPVRHEEIYGFGKWRNPMNHVTVMFRKDAYQAVGGYRSIRYYEDYDLFIRMLLAGIRFGNIPRVLVHVRCGNEMFGRRGGLNQITNECKLLWGMYTQGYVNLGEMVINSSLRLPTRIMPSWLRRWLYCKFLRGKKATSRNFHFQ